MISRGRAASRGASHLPRTVNQVVALVLTLGILGVLALAWLVPLMKAPFGVPGQVASSWLVVLFVALAASGELLSVRVWRSGTSEDLTFLEAVLVAAALSMPPVAVLVSVLLGLLAASIIQRRDWPKTLFNLGSYATSTSVAMLVFYSLNQGHPRFSWESVLSLTAGTMAFGLINIAFLSLVFHVVAGDVPARFIGEEWPLSAFMALGGVGVGMTGVFLATMGAWPLLPFVAMPALALWYAYGAAAQHVEARDRNRWLVALGGSLAQHGRGDDSLLESVEAIRRIVGAPEVTLLDPAHCPEGSAGSAVLDSLYDDPGPRALVGPELPSGWRTGVITRMDVGAESQGALLLGSTVPYRRSRIAGRTRGWSLEEADAPVLGALVAAVGSAMRAGAAFDALTEETEKLSAVVDNTSDGIAMVDDNGAIRLWSQTMATMTGVDAAGLTDAASAPPIVRTLVDASRASRNASPVQVHLVRGDGEELDVSLSTVRVREAMTSSSADSSGWVSILTVHDETRERRVERMKTDFVATISHELRTPITPIKGYAHLLATRGDRVPPEKRIAALQVISDRADHLTRLVDDLLLASQVSDGARLAIEMGLADLREIVRQAVDTFPSMSARIRLELPDEALMVQCDRIRAMQCLANLIGNAEKYAPGDTPVDISVTVAGFRAQVHVRDHGPGIPAVEHEKVFERFYRREDPFTMRTGGAGLGLHIARELAVAMGGGLELRTPVDGSGAEFVLHLPTAEAPTAGAQQLGSIARMRPAARPHADGGSMRAASADTVGEPAQREGPASAADGTIGPEAHRAAM